MRHTFHLSLILLLAVVPAARAIGATAACGPELVEAAACEGWLRKQHIDPQTELRGRQSEEELVRAALGTLRRQIRWNGWEMSCLWTSLASHIERLVGHPVSRGYRWQRGGRLRYVFQGEKTIQGRRYVLILSPSGKAWTGLSEPIVDIDHWEPPAGLRRFVLQ